MRKRESQKIFMPNLEVEKKTRPHKQRSEEKINGFFFLMNSSLRQFNNPLLLKWSSEIIYEL